jgi:hypothetical protein
MIIKLVNIDKTDRVVELDIKSVSYKHYRIPHNLAAPARDHYLYGVKAYLANTDFYMVRYSPKNKVHFFETRGFDNPLRPNPRGGKTEIVVTMRTKDDSIEFYLGYAVCSLEDNFCYAKGRFTAFVDVISHILTDNNIKRSKKFIMSLAMLILNRMYYYGLNYENNNEIILDMTAKKFSIDTNADANKILGLCA